MIIQLVYNEGSGRIMFDDYELHCGDSLEVLLIGKDGKPRWVETSLEYNGHWYIPGFPGIQVPGLFAKGNT